MDTFDMVDYTRQLLRMSPQDDVQAPDDEEVVHAYHQRFQNATSNGLLSDGFNDNAHRPSANIPEDYRSQYMADQL